MYMAEVKRFQMKTQLQMHGHDHGSQQETMEAAGKHKTQYDKPVKTRAWKRSHLGKALATKECHHFQTATRIGKGLEYMSGFSFLLFPVLPVSLVGQMIRH